MTSHAPNLTLEEYEYILRNDFAAFLQCGFYELNPQTTYQPSPHIELIASKLDACRRGKMRRLILNVPPRSLKSHCASIAFSAWLLGHNPGERVICASYGQDLAEKLARDTRTLMSSDWYKALFQTRIAGQAIHDLTTNAGGYRMATSVGGVLTGRGGNFIIIDDPLKPDEALSESQRDKVNEWYSHSLLSRQDDKEAACIIIVMQRLHQDDLVGHVLEQDDWEVLSLPAICEVDESHIIESPFGKRKFHRQPGEALHPQRESLATLAKIRQGLGEYNFTAQYQQNPTPRGGALIKTAWLRYYEPGSEPARFQRIVQSWDTANKAGDLNDFSVCTTWGVNGKDVYLLHVVRRRLNYPELKRAVAIQRSLYPRCTIVIEDKASGTQLIQELKRDGVPVTPYTTPTGTDKLMRLHAQTAWFENGRVFLPNEAHWLNDYVAELTGFPGTKFADQVDSTAQALDHIGSIPGPLIITDEVLRRLKEHNWQRYRGPRHRGPFGSW
jgi:predicted phage terminase large subunit-like protein